MARPKKELVEEPENIEESPQVESEKEHLLKLLEELQSLNVHSISDLENRIARL